MSEYLDEVKARVEAATDGPWSAEFSGEQGNCVVPHDARSTREAVCVTHLHRAVFDAEFIAHARADVPALLEAVEAVLALHPPIDVCGNARHTNLTVACPDCETVCDFCAGAYPCPTVQAITDALEER